MIKYGPFLNNSTLQNQDDDKQAKQEKEEQNSSRSKCHGLIHV
jgi:hypothetical protein